MLNIYEVADKADLIINGYAFTKCDEGYKVLNLNRTDKAALISEKGEVIETTMDDIEISIINEYLDKNRKYMED